MLSPWISPAFSTAGYMLIELRGDAVNPEVCLWNLQMSSLISWQVGIVGKDKRKDLS